MRERPLGMGDKLWKLRAEFCAIGGGITTNIWRRREKNNRIFRRFTLIKRIGIGRQRILLSMANFAHFQ
jgi:hypothetical protein